VPQTRRQISAASGPKFTILWRHVEEILLFNKFFSDCNIALVIKIWPNEVVRWCTDGEFFGSCIQSEPCALQHISNMHSKFALGPHHV